MQADLWTPLSPNNATCQATDCWRFRFSNSVRMLLTWTHKVISASSASFGVFLSLPCSLLSCRPHGAFSVLSINTVFSKSFLMAEERWRDQEGWGDNDGRREKKNTVRMWSIGFRQINKQQPSLNGYLGGLCVMCAGCMREWVSGDGKSVGAKCTSIGY